MLSGGFSVDALEYELSTFNLTQLLLSYRVISEIKSVGVSGKGLSSSGTLCCLMMAILNGEVP